MQLLYDKLRQRDNCACVEGARFNSFHHTHVQFQLQIFAVMKIMVLRYVAPCDLVGRYPPLLECQISYLPFCYVTFGKIAEGKLSHCRSAFKTS